ncbi:MAG: hypothetical protein D6731_19130, partial [Planctomycetota bacterium]
FLAVFLAFFLAFFLAVFFLAAFFFVAFFFVAFFLAFFFVAFFLAFFFVAFFLAFFLAFFFATGNLPLGMELGRPRPPLPRGDRVLADEWMQVVYPTQPTGLRIWIPQIRTPSNRRGPHPGDNPLR